MSFLFIDEKGNNMDDLLLIAGGRKIFGWESVRVTRGIERCPNDFELTMTERFPGELDFVLKPGDLCNLYIGDPDLDNQYIDVLAGYVDRVAMNLSARNHTITVTGRGKCQDLVDCAAQWPSGQFSNQDVLSIATKLAAPYGIDVTGRNLVIDSTTRKDVALYAGTTEARGVLKLIPKLSLSWGETIFSRIEEMARWSGCLAYEGTDGNLILSRVSIDKTGTGGRFEQGNNIETASVIYSMDQRYSKYVVRMLGTNVLGDLGNGGDILMEVTDDNVPRPRVHFIITESGDAGGDVAKLRGIWEMKRRWGRGNQIRITTDTWRRQDGGLWEINTLVEVSLPALKVPNIPWWLITEVAFERNERGTQAHLVLMPPEAFDVEPVLPSWEKGFSDVKAQ